VTKKKPDLVVWNEERGYYQRELTYGTNHGAPAIKLDDVSGWKESQIHSANKQFKTRYDELKEEFQKLVDEVNFNELVYSSKYSFIPIVGEPYYLYDKEDGTTFMSLIQPNQWNKKYIGTFKLDSTHKWVKLN
jgi:hypothetical protein